MSLKALFSELYVHRNDPPEEFKELPAFVELSGKPDVVAKVDKFVLPEVIKLICCSPELMKSSFAEKYKTIQSLYCMAEVEPLLIIQRLGEAERFESEILKYADFNILMLFDKFFIDMKKEEKRLEAQITNQAAAIQEEQKQKEADENGLESKREQLKEDEVALNNAKRFLANPTQKTIIKKLKLYKKSYEDGVDEKRRDEAYRILTQIDRENDIDATVKQIAELGALNQIQVNQFRNPNYLMSVLFYLSKEENKRKAIEILLKLYDIGAIDINESPVLDFITANSDLLLDYLLGISPDTVEDTKAEDLNALVDLALKLECEYNSNGSNARFCSFWNTLVDEFDWTWMITKILELYPADFNTVAGILMRGLTGKASRAYVNVLFGSDAPARKKAVVEIFSSALSHTDSCEKDSIINVLRILERNSRSVQVKLNTATRKLSCQSQELFSSMYVPLEHLEELAINLSITSGQIDASLVGKQLRDELAELRGSLEIFDLKAVADIDDWKDLKDVPFDSKHHKLTIDLKNPPNTVTIKSLGFSYTDDEGVQKERPAQVFRRKKIARRGQSDTTQPPKDNEPKLKRERNASAEKIQRKNFKENA